MLVWGCAGESDAEGGLWGEIVVGPAVMIGEVGVDCSSSSSKAVGWLLVSEQTSSGPDVAYDICLRRPPPLPWIICVCDVVCVVSGDRTMLDLGTLMDAC